MKTNTSEENSKTKILNYIRNNGETTVTTLSDVLQITPMAIRKHLSSLIIQKKLVSRTTNKKIGRPQMVYILNTKEDSEHFFAMEILESVEATYGTDGLVNLFSRRNKKFFETYEPRVQGKSTKDKIYETAKIFNENGFETIVREDKSSTEKLSFEHKKCPFIDVARKFSTMCSLEPKLLEQFIGKNVTKVCYICNGDGCCRYEVYI